MEKQSDQLQLEKAVDFLNTELLQTFSLLFTFFKVFLYLIVYTLRRNTPKVMSNIYFHRSYDRHKECNYIIRYIMFSARRHYFSI